MERTDRPADYLGYPSPVGPHLRYAIVDRRARWLGCLLFSYAARLLPCRDDFIGWDEAARRKRLDRVVGNPRFLILPWVRVANLASKALSLATRRLADDWKARHGYRPVLVETFVDPARFDGACYRAAELAAPGRDRGQAVGAHAEKRVRAAAGQGLPGGPGRGRRRAPRPAPPGGSADALGPNGGGR